MIDLSICVQCAPEGDGDLLEKGLAVLAVLASIVALGFSWRAMTISGRHHRAGVRQNYFQPHSDAISAARRSLETLIDDLRRSAEATVPLDTLYENFSLAFGNVTGAVETFTEVLAEVDEADQFGKNWSGPVRTLSQNVDADYDLVLNDQRLEADRRSAASRVVTNLTAMIDHAKSQTRAQIESQASAR